MRWLLRGFSLMIITMLVTATAYAQDPPSGRWWRSPQVANQLQLTDGEKERLEKAFSTSRLKMIDLKSKVEAEQFKLQTLVEKKNFDEAGIKAQHRKLERARTALADERFAFFVEVRKIIGHDRFQKLLAMHAANKQKGNRK